MIEFIRSLRSNREHNPQLDARVRNMMERIAARKEPTLRSFPRPSKPFRQSDDR